MRILSVHLHGKLLLDGEQFKTPSILRLIPILKMLSCGKCASCMSPEVCRYSRSNRATPLIIRNLSSFACLPSHPQQMASVVKVPLGAKMTCKLQILEREEVKKDKKAKDLELIGLPRLKTGQLETIVFYLGKLVSWKQTGLLLQGKKERMDAE